jgi:hypothetical protein
MSVGKWLPIDECEQETGQLYYIRRMLFNGLVHSPASWAIWNGDEWDVRGGDMCPDGVPDGADIQQWRPTLIQTVPPGGEEE